MRLIVLIFLLLFIAAGVVFGALNADLVGYDLGFASVSLPKGAAMLAALLLGWILGGLTAWLGTASKHRRRLRRERAQANSTASPNP
jgi:lipopolysaccharide assembly protein A